MISEIRDYFTNCIREVEPDFIADGQIFDTQVSGGLQLERSYTLIIGNSTVSKLDTSYARNFLVNLHIFSKSGTDKVQDHDDVYEKALDLSASLMCADRIDQLGFIKDVLENGVTREQLDGDDNSCKFQLEFNVQTYYSVD